MLLPSAAIYPAQLSSAAIHSAAIQQSSYPAAIQQLSSTAVHSAAIQCSYPVQLSSSYPAQLSSAAIQQLSSAAAIEQLCSSIAAIEQLSSATITANALLLHGTAIAHLQYPEAVLRDAFVVGLLGPFRVYGGGVQHECVS